MVRARMVLFPFAVFKVAVGEAPSTIACGDYFEVYFSVVSLGTRRLALLGRIGLAGANFFEPFADLLLQASFGWLVKSCTY